MLAEAQKVSWVLESNLIAASLHDELRSHILAAGLPLHEMAFLPFTHEPVGEVPDVSGPCVVYGAAGIQEYAVSQGWSPGVWTSSLFTPAHYAAELGELYLNNGQVICRLRDVVSVALGLTLREFFLRPNGEGKNFNSGPMSIDEASMWLDRLAGQGLLDENDVEVAIAPCREIGREWRIVIVDGRVVAHSQYKRFGRRWDDPSIEPEALAVAVEAVRRFHPVDVFVADVCETAGGMKIVEYNTFNSAGLYACDVGAVVGAVTAWVVNGDS